MVPNPNQLPYRPCVGIMVLNTEGLVWVGRRMDAPAEPEGPGKWWQMPQGGIDAGEEPKQAALRELYEETNIRSVRFLAESHAWLTYDLPPHLVGVAWKGRYRGQKQKWFAVRFTGSDEEIDIAHPAGSHKPEFDAWKWVRLDELPELIVPFKRVVYEEIVAEFEPLVRGAKT